MNVLERGIIETKIFDVQFANPASGVAYIALMKTMGSPRAFYAEFLLAETWNAHYYRENQSNGFDLFAKDRTKRHLEVKATNTTGAVDLTPSSGKGASRTPKMDQFWANCAAVDYVIVDSAYLKETGDIRYVILSGVELCEQQVHKLSKKQVAALFENIA